MVELYAELLLARANVLDSVAYGEKGTMARGRGKEVWKRWSAKSHNKQHQSPTTHTAKGGGSGGGGGGGGGWFLSRRAPEEPPAGSDSQTESTESSAYIDPALDEAATAIFYAYPRFPHDVRELTILRSLLADRWGKEFMTLASEDREDLGVRVPRRLVRVLRVEPPGQDLVERYLGEIARAYGVNFSEGVEGVEGDVPEVPEVDTGRDGDDGEGDGGGGDVSAFAPKTPTPAPATQPQPGAGSEERRPSEELTLTRATPPRGLPDRPSPISVSPPGARVDNPNPRVKLPDSGPASTSETPGSGAGAESGSGTAPGTGAAAEEKKEEVGTPRGTQGGGRNIPEVDELTRRFAALRR